MQNNKKPYTGGGDGGYTKTLSNFRVSKADALIELLGAIDEFSAMLSLAGTFVTDTELLKDIESVRRRFEDIGAEAQGGERTVTKECVAAVENMIDAYRLKTAKHTAEVKDNSASAALGAARTMVRRAERAAVKAGQFGRLKPEYLAYLNRMSDLIAEFEQYAKTVVGAGGTVSEAEKTAHKTDMLTLAMAKQVSEEIEKQAHKMGLSIVTAIADGGANLMLLHSMDDAYIASAKIAQDKAYTSVALKMPTITALELSRGGALDGLSYTSENRIILLGGGEPLKMNGRIVGGLGVSGGTAEEDTALARFGAQLFTRLYSM